MRAVQNRREGSGTQSCGVNEGHERINHIPAFTKVDLNVDRAGTGLLPTSQTRDEEV